MASSQSYEVTIVGGGLGGLTAALALRQRGVKVTVLEQAAQLGEVGAGIQTAPNASRILLGLGLRKQLEAIHTEPLDQVRRRWKDGKVVALTPLGERVKKEYNAPYWHYHRADLHRVIMDACTDPEGPGPRSSCTPTATSPALTAAIPSARSRSPRTARDLKRTSSSARTASGRVSVT
ncbi:NAD(P)-binding protein [Streptomyces sp. M10(2022)]